LLLLAQHIPLPLAQAELELGQQVAAALLVEIQFLLVLQQLLAVAVAGVAHLRD
jgi:hypothetical protein